MHSLKRYLVTTVTFVATAVAFAVAPTQAAAAPVVLYANVGPGYVISLKSAGGVPIKSVRAGRAYTIVVRDQSKIHNFRLGGPGVNRSTTVAFVGTVRWSVTFRAGTYGYVCNPHSSMNGRFKAA